MTSGVYRIRNLLNQKCYFGSAGLRGVERRFCEHRRLLELGKHHSTSLQRAWNKYGPKNFSFELVEECAPEDCLRREQYYLDTVLFADCQDQRFSQLGYNVSRSAQAVMTGRSHAAETKERISRSRRGKYGGVKHGMFGRKQSRKAIEANRRAHTKLQPQEILRIRELLISGLSQEAIAKKFDVHQSTISLIKNEKLWPLTGVPGGCFICGIAAEA